MLKIQFIELLAIHEKNINTKENKSMKKLNNKGFSLVELIIVIAIMAVLIAVLAPQFLRYVERSRLGTDNTAIGEVANAVKAAAASERINTEMGTNSPVTIEIPTTGTGGPVVCSGTSPLLQAELDATLGTNLLLRSSTYTGAATAPTVVATVTGGAIVVTGTDYVSEVGIGATGITF